jgi:hypothetical protein
MRHETVTMVATEIPVFWNVTSLTDGFYRNIGNIYQTTPNDSNLHRLGVFEDVKDNIWT